MDASPGRGAARRHQGRSKRRPAGLALIARDGFWHVTGTVVAAGRRSRIRQTTRIAARPELFEAADEERRRIEAEIRGSLKGERGAGPFISVAGEAYLGQTRTRPLGATSAAVVLKINAQFGLRRFSDVTDAEWTAWVDKRMAGNASATRERFLNSALAFFNWCAKKPRRWCDPPTFDRDNEARNPRRRARRAVDDLSTTLVAFVIDHAAPHLAPQIWVQWSTGARVSSILRGCRLCDLILAPGREQITFHGTKNGDTVKAHLHPRAIAALKRYLDIRGRLHDREGLLFLRPDGRPYKAAGSGQNKTAFNGMKRRARKALRRQAIDAARREIALGRREAAAHLVAEARSAHRLIGRLTQHWFRHMLATKLRGDIRAAMDQGGWRDERSVMAYTIDVPQHRRNMVRNLDAGEDDGTLLTRRSQASDEKTG